VVACQVIFTNQSVKVFMVLMGGVFGGGGGPPPAETPMPPQLLGCASLVALDPVPKLISQKLPWPPPMAKCICVSSKRCERDRTVGIWGA